MNTPEVSVCVPTYNGKEHLAECLNSIISQSFKNFEVLLCDDESSDGTLDFARQLAGSDPRFRFIANPRRFGLVGNWNNCVQQARGEWIKFVFQDDIISPACVEKLLAACRREGKLFGFCERDFIFEEGTSEAMNYWCADHKQKVRSDYQASPVISASQAARLAALDPSHNAVGEPTVTLINKKLFQEFGGFDENLIQLCDSDFWCRVMINHGAVFVPESLAAFRIHAKAETTRNLGKREYRTRYLDPLALRYKQAFHEDFKPVRNSRVTGKSVIALRWRCATAAALAWSRARKGRRSGDNSLLQEWETIKSHYPRLQRIAVFGCGLNVLTTVRNEIKRRFFHTLRTK
jgi:glycosyltransferase involved in cell wall biosynthesis